jgi:chromosome segregation ATPase
MNDDELELHDENRIAALAALRERLMTLEREHADLVDRLDVARRLEAQAETARARMAQELEDMTNRARIAEYDLGVVGHEAATTKWQLETELHEAREALAAATERAVRAESHPIEHLVDRLRTRARRLVR